MTNTNKSNQCTYKNRVKQFNQTTKSTTRKKNRTRKVNKSNPYLMARTQILNDFPQWRRNEVMQMEKENNIDNHHYENFVHLVAELGDIISDKNLENN